MHYDLDDLVCHLLLLKIGLLNFSHSTPTKLGILKFGKGRKPSYIIQTNLVTTEASISQGWCYYLSYQQVLLSPSQNLQSA